MKNKLIREFFRVFENDNFIIDYDRYNNQYRVSYFEDNHFKEECYFDAYEDKELEYIKEEFDRPIKNLYSADVILCMALGINDGGCKNCPVTLFNYDKRTEYEKCCLHEPCQTNLYKWLKDTIKNG